MKASQKGTKLNDIRTFRQPRPYTRKRITEMRLFPDISGVHGDSTSSSKDPKKRLISSRSSGRSTDRCTILDRDRKSREIAWVSYTSDERKSENFDHIQKHCENRVRDIFTETQPEIEIANLPESLNSIPEITDVKLQLESEVEKNVENIPEKEEKKLEANFVRNREFDEKPTKENVLEKEEKKLEATFVRNREFDEKPTKENVLEKEEKKLEATFVRNREFDEKPTKENVLEKEDKKLEANFVRNREFDEKPTKEIERKRHRGKYEGRTGESSSSNGEKSFWWRYESIRKILDFFGHLLRRRGTTNREKNIPANAQGRQRVGTRIESSRNDKMNETKNYSMKNRTRRSKLKSTTVRRNLTTVQAEDLFFDGPTKQIPNTRDEMLRATLVEREMRNRKLEEENRRYKKLFEDNLKTRQMSSPLH